MVVYSNVCYAFVGIAFYEQINKLQLTKECRRWYPMKISTKIIITAITLILFMMVLPLLAIKLFPDWTGIGLWFISFLTVNPILVVCLSIMAGTEFRKLWWIPLAVAVLFPLLFGIAISDFVWDLYAYSAIYLPVGVLAMLGTHFGKKMTLKKQKGGEQE